jgi:hypothetical protein
MKKMLDKPSKTIPCIMMLMLLSLVSFKGDSRFVETVKVESSMTQNLEVEDKSSNKVVVVSTPVVSTPVSVEEIKQKPVYKPRIDTVQKVKIQAKKKPALSRGGSPIKQTAEVETIKIYIRQIASKYDMDPELIMSVVYQESRFNPNAKNGNCLGLMQVSKRWHSSRAAKLGVKDFYDPYSNILLGVDYLSELHAQYKDMRLVLMLYNMEHKTALRLYKSGQISNYAKTIISRAGEYKKGE